MQVTAIAVAAAAKPSQTAVNSNVTVDEPADSFCAIRSSQRLLVSSRRVSGGT